jgi:hypothetical protein
MQRAQRAKERRRLMIVAGAVGAVIVVIAVVAIVLTSGGSSTASPLNVSAQIIPATPVGPTTVQQPPTRVPNTTGIPGVMAWDTKGYPASGTADAGTLEHQHVTGPVTYAVVPPVGGPHNAVWMNAGVYTKPVPSERAVHNLEHGAVWITYRPNLPATEVAKLVTFVGSQSLIPESEQASPGQANRYMDLSPWATNSLPAPIVISSWGYQLRVQSPTDPRLQRFVDTFRYNKTYTPEFPGAPVDGQPVSTSGRPAGYGSKNPT